jgi:chemotaxis protein methyltransferase CheR
MELSLGTFANLRSLIYDQTGIFFQDTKRYVLEGRLLTRLKERNCSSYEEYYSLLKFDAWRDKEMAVLYDLVTTNETYFYRDNAQLNAFMTTVIPDVMKTNQATSTLRIWSAACSTGDEAYTLAIMMQEHPVLAKWNVEIIASDISERVLDTARRGVYGQYALRHVPPPLLAKYFTKEQGQYELAPGIRRKARFLNLNLYDSARLKLVRGMDVVLCRNCLIYFDDKAKQKIVGNLYDCLRPNGYLIIGFSESLHNITRSFKPVHAEKSVVYQKL